MIGNENMTDRQKGYATGVMPDADTDMGEYWAGKSQRMADEAHWKKLREQSDGKGLAYFAALVAVCGTAWVLWTMAQFVIWIALFGLVALVPLLRFALPEPMRPGLGGAMAHALAAWACGYIGLIVIGLVGLALASMGGPQIIPQAEWVRDGWDGSTPGTAEWMLVVSSSWNWMTLLLAWVAGACGWLHVMLVKPEGLGSATRMARIVAVVLAALVLGWLANRVLQPGDPAKIVSTEIVEISE